MTTAISLEELLAWNRESSNFWKLHLDANPALLQLPCGIGGTANVQEFVRHIWGVELRWSQRLAGRPEMPREEMPSGPLPALFELHLKAVDVYKRQGKDAGLGCLLSFIHLDKAAVELDASLLQADTRCV